MYGYGWEGSCLALKAKPTTASRSVGPPELLSAEDGTARYPVPVIRESVRWHQLVTTPSGLAQFWLPPKVMNENGSMVRSKTSTAFVLSAARVIRKVVPTWRSVVQLVPQNIASPAP